MLSNPAYITAEMNLRNYDNSKSQNTQWTFSRNRWAELSILNCLALHHIPTMSLNKVLLQVQFHLHNKWPSLAHSTTQTCSMTENDLWFPSCHCKKSVTTLYSHDNSIPCKTHQYTIL